jgi:hypothetical protein
MAESQEWKHVEPILGTRAAKFDGCLANIAMVQRLGLAMRNREWENLVWE